MTAAARLRWWLPGALAAIVLLVAIVGLLRRGDLLAVPAATLVVLTWLVLALGLIVTWLLRDALPPVARDAAQLLRAAARGLDDDPLGRRVNDRARRIRAQVGRVTPVSAVGRFGRWAAVPLRPTERGLGLTAATAVAVASPAALWALDRQVDRSTSAVAQLDVRFVDLAANIEVPAQRAIMAAVTVLGNAATVVALIALLVVAALAARAVRGLVLPTAVPTLAMTLTTALKHLESRVRPALGQLVETSASWPSGHATVGLAFALGVCLLVWRGGVRHWALIAALVVPTGLLVGYSRAYLSLVIAADEATLRAAVTGAGFDIADRVTFRRLLATYRTGVLGDADPTAPVTPTFFGEHVQDLAIQQSIRGVTARHHARLWRLPVRLADGCAVWVATASRDTGVEWTWRTVLPNHRIDPVVDAERDYIAARLARTGRLDATRSRRVVPPMLGTNAAGDPFFTDGNAAVLRQPNGCTGSSSR